MDEMRVNQMLGIAIQAGKFTLCTILCATGAAGANDGADACGRESGRGYLIFSLQVKAGHPLSSAYP